MFVSLRGRPLRFWKTKPDKEDLTLVA